MKRLMFLFATLLLVQFCGCAKQNVTPTVPPTEPTVLQTDPIETLPPVTDPPPTEAPTEPPEPTIPSLGEAAGSRYECYYSDEYDDYLIYPKDDTAAALASAITAVCAMDGQRRREVGEAGQNYVLTCKNALSQTKRILDFLSTLSNRAES